MPLIIHTPRIIGWMQKVNPQLIINRQGSHTEE